MEGVTGSTGLTTLTLCLAEASRLCLGSTSAEVRLGVILADNAVELLLLGMAEDFIFSDRWSTSPKWDYDRRVRIHTTFEAKVVAAVEQGWLDLDDAEVARTGHYIRNAAYHRGEAVDDRVAAVWCPLVLKLALRLATAQAPGQFANLALPRFEPVSEVLDLCSSTVQARIDRVLAGLHEYATACTGPLPPDDELDDILATAEAAWGVGVIETSPGRQREEIKRMLRTHVFDGSPLRNRQLTLARLRAWQSEARAHRASLRITSVAPWWRTVDRRLTIYEKTVDLANL